MILLLYCWGLDAGEEAFQQLVQDSNLADLPLANGEYTWFSSRNYGLWSRLDRWLVSDEDVGGLEDASNMELLKLIMFL